MGTVERFRAREPVAAAASNVAAMVERPSAPAARSRCATPRCGQATPRGGSTGASSSGSSQVEDGSRGPPPGSSRTAASSFARRARRRSSSCASSSRSKPTTRSSCGGSPTTRCSVGRFACFRGKRPLRVGTVTQALVRAVCGQLIPSREARKIERALIRSTCESDGVLYVPPTPACFAGPAPAQLQRFGLTAAKGLDDRPLLPDDRPRAAARMSRRQGSPSGSSGSAASGPWSVGVIGLQGLGCYELGLVGDLGLIKLCTALLGRPAEPEDTAELLEPVRRVAGPRERLPARRRRPRTSLPGAGCAP